jgi:uncharacterized membrane protein
LLRIINRKINGKNISLNFIVILIVFSISYYLLAYRNFSISSPFNNIIIIFKDIWIQINKDLFSTSQSQSFIIITSLSPNILSLFHRFIGMFFQILIVLGILFTLFRILTNKKVAKKLKLYTCFSIPLFLLLVVSVFVPSISNSMGATRLYTIIILFLALYIILGFKLIFLIFSKVNSKINHHFAIKSLFSILLILFLLYQSTVFYYISDQSEGSWNINPDMDGPVFNKKDVECVKWGQKYWSGNIPFRTDHIRIHLFRAFGPDYYFYRMLPTEFYTNSEEFYIFLNEKNFKLNQIMLTTEEHLTPWSYPMNFSGFDKILNYSSHEIYDNSYAFIFYKY